MTRSTVLANLLIGETDLKWRCKRCHELHNTYIGAAVHFAQCRPRLINGDVEGIGAVTDRRRSSDPEADALERRGTEEGDQRQRILTNPNEGLNEIPPSQTRNGQTEIQEEQPIPSPIHERPVEHQAEPTIHICPECQRGFDTKAGMQLHRRKPTTERCPSRPGERSSLRKSSET